MNISFMKKFQPDFIGIGAARAGSSWLWENITSHPDVWKTTSKEKHFFDRRIDKMRPDSFLQKLRYLALFLPGKILGKKVGEITPAYAVQSQDTIALINKWMPDQKIIYVMRNPIDRTWSHAKKDFSEMYKRKLCNATESELIDFCKQNVVSLRNDYITCIANWRQCYSGKQIHYMFLEDIVAQPDKELESLYLFLDLDPRKVMDVSQGAKKVHASSSAQKIPQCVIEYLAPVVAHQKSGLEKLLDRDIPWKDISQ